MSNHFYIHSDILPKDTDTQDEWEQRVVMLADLTSQMAESLFAYLGHYAPLLVQPDQFGGHFISAMGVLAKGIRDTGRAQLEKRGLKPLDAEEEQLRMIRNRLAKPDLPIDEREFLLQLLAHNLECQDHNPAPVSEEMRAESDQTGQPDFPEGGFVIGDGE